MLALDWGGLMESPNSERVIHSYDPERRQVLCGALEQTNSTKHAASVTCVTCRELLGRARALGRSAGAGGHAAD
jgi:hypothetical protein